jgi:signal transduction histidine kinase
MMDWLSAPHQFGASDTASNCTMKTFPDASWDEALSRVLHVHESGLHSLKTHDPACLFESMVQAVAVTTLADCAAILVADVEGDVLRLAADRRFTGELRCLFEPDGDAHALCRHVLRRRRTICVDNVGQAAALREAVRRGLLNAGLSACLLVPMVGSSRSGVGVLTACFRSAHMFTHDEIRRVELIAAHSVTFVETIRLHEVLEKRLSEEREAHERVDAMNRRKDQFIATLSHELRQPLSAAIPAVEVQKRSLSAERRHRAGEVIEQQLRQIARLVEDLADVSHISRGTLELRLDRIDLRVVLRQAIDMTQELFDGKGQDISVSLADRPAIVEGDAVRLKQVFSNLLRNAASYTPSHGRVAMSLAREGDDLVVRVRDTGIGIPEQALGRIFQIFERGNGSVPPHGLGIGLAIVRQIVEMHGGTVAAGSAGAGEGSEFVVRLPAADLP